MCWDTRRLSCAAPEGETGWWTDLKEVFKIYEVLAPQANEG
ncbi:MAG: hypothetical protein ACTS5P_02260 [Candidatus Hodgkinia cicadicola]